MLKKLVLFSFTILLGSMPCFGDIIFNDAFDYADGVPPAPWVVNTGIGGQLISGSRLVMTPGAAAAVQTSPTGTADYQRTFAAALNTGTVFAGFDLVITSAPTDSGDNYFSHFVAPPGGGSQNTGRVFLNLSGVNTLLGLSEISGTAVSSSPTPLALNTTLRVVQSYDLATGTASVWLNPTSNLESALLTDASGGNAVSITGFQFRINNATDGAKVIDNLIVATTFAEAANITAVPEPSSFALVGLLSLLAFRKCKRSNS